MEIDGGNGDGEPSKAAACVGFETSDAVKLKQGLENKGDHLSDHVLGSKQGEEFVGPRNTLGHKEKEERLKDFQGGLGNTQPNSVEDSIQEIEGPRGESGCVDQEGTSTSRKGNHGV
ncbi:hypothetical protein L6452_04964 [Arctium lappa]|uniref:Uncharacterized protein n=1 Tax=Arctium lappa TaxID=4217 RepID=A0ACB9EF42_ARCLA|nr:hypothetical protein L6452_04964 [Arctium lappa]